MPSFSVEATSCAFAVNDCRAWSASWLATVLAAMAVGSTPETKTSTAAATGVLFLARISHLSARKDDR